MNRTRALALLVFANALWGCSYAISKVALTEIPPPLLGALRLVGATILLWLALLWHARRTGLSLRMPRRDAAKIGGLGLCGLSVDYLLGYWGVSLTTATDASLMIIGEVIFTTLLAVWLLGERLGPRKLAGIGLGAAGVALLVFGNLSAGSAGGDGLARAAGDLLLLLGLMGATTYSVLGTSLARRYHPLLMITYANTGSMLLWVPLLLWYTASGRFPALTLAPTLSVMYLVLFTSFVGPLIWFSVLSKTNASLGAIALFGQPLFGSLVGLLVLGDPLTPALLIGGALIFVALFLMVKPERQPALERVLAPSAAE